MRQRWGRRATAAPTIADITGQAAVSRRTFYEHFENKDECFVAAVDLVAEQLRERAGEAFESEDAWPAGLRAAILAMLAFLASEPDLARLGVVEPFVAGPVVVERYDAAVLVLVPYLRAGREVAPKKIVRHLPDSTENALAGGVVSIISRRILAGEVADLEALLPSLVEFALTPYLGREKATRIARV